MCTAPFERKLKRSPTLDSIFFKQGEKHTILLAIDIEHHFFVIIQRKRTQ